MHEKVNTKPEIRDSYQQLPEAGYLYFALGAAVLTFDITHNVRSTISDIIVAGAGGIPVAS
jgi:hypothetical protein